MDRVFSIGKLTLATQQPQGLAFACGNLYFFFCFFFVFFSRSRVRLALFFLKNSCPSGTLFFKVVSTGNHVTPASKLQSALLS